MDKLVWCRCGTHGDALWRWLFLRLGLAALFLPFAADELRAEAQSPDLRTLLSGGHAKKDEAAKLRRITIPAGVYRLEAGKERAHLLLADLHDVTIDARGVQIVFATPGVEGVVFERCSGVTWLGGVFTREELPYSQGRLEEISADGRRMLVRIADGYPARYTESGGDGQLSFFVFDPLTRRLKPKARDFHSERLEPVDALRFALWLEYPLSGAGCPAVGDLLAWRGVVSSDVRLIGCGTMRFEDTTVRGGGGFCFYEGDGPGGNFYKVGVTYPVRPSGASEEPLLSSNADAFHSVDMRVGPRLVGCLFEGMGDDGIAIHGNYARVVEAKANGLELSAFGGFELKEGDRLQITDHDGKLIARAIAAKVGPWRPAKAGKSRWMRFGASPNCQQATVVLDRPVTCQADFLVANENALGAGFLIRDSIVRNHRPRGMLIKSVGGVIERNTIEGSTMGGIVVGPEMSTWAESGYSADLILRNNRIRRVGLWQQESNPMVRALTVAAFEMGAYVPDAAGHENIVIEGNVFEENDGINLLVTSARGVRIQGNGFVAPLSGAQANGAQFGLRGGTLAVILESAQVELQRNWISRPGRFFKDAVFAPGCSSPERGFELRTDEAGSR